MEIPIIYEDESVVVIEKPSGVVCNRAETVTDETIQDWFVRKFQIPNPKFQTNSNNQILNGEEYFRARGGLVHRLDRETSGVMVMAKTPEAFGELLRQFKERETKKEYLALTHGLWKVREGTIELPIARMRSNRKMMGVRENGRESQTEYEVQEEFGQVDFPKELKVETRGYGGFSLVKFMPKTGRMHQIRVHSKHVGHPVVGDELYAGRKRSREDRKWAGRVMLQSVSLELTHPKTQVRMKFESKNRDWEQALEYLKK